MRMTPFINTVHALHLKKLQLDILTTDKSIGAVLRPVESALHTRLLRVHGVNGAGC